MALHGKRYVNDAKEVQEGKVYSLPDAVQRIKAFKPAKFDQTIDICVHLGIDPKVAEQNLRGSLSLPHGVGGKSKRVIAFCPSDKVEAAKANGAIEAGGEDLVKKVEAGFLDFDVAVATPDMMRLVSKLGKVLGPKGLMPSPKAGTVTPDVATAVREYAAGKIEYRNDAGGNIHAPVGKLSFEADKLASNVQAFLDEIQRRKPASAKGQYVKKISLSGTMTPGVLVAIVTN
jgi:large subunit ribosomal protein L1